ncbi:hypothetical protein K8Z61_12310 [Nocardioides sp. TRM66260-LWL]|uniref:hypothetical protein n=1 Tax=Nocardioides sp. TRM66260-LWL TaxID=2874478 RepID=UPI001CC3E341|nr:hypothetical protein [Nocardioides sp. TRM66260-LWL]MBZ5735278.1 hypothetical protein [Nocardioides sp. TRM66260-LWL]
MHAPTRPGLVAAALLLPLLAVVGTSAPAALADGPEPAPVTVPLPALPAGATVGRVALAGDVVFAGVGTTASDGARTSRVLTTAADGTGSWSAVQDPSTGQPIDQPLVAVAGDVLLLRARPGLHCAGYRLIGSVAGAPVDRRLESCGDPRLGGGGQAVSTRGADVLWRVEQVVDGSAWPGSDSVRASHTPEVDGTTVWDVEPGSTTLRALDLRTGDVVGRALPGGCGLPDGVLAAGGGLVAVRCLDVAALLDTTRAVSPRQIPDDVIGLSATLSLSATAGQDEVRVDDLGTAHRTWTFARSSRGLVDGDDRLSALDADGSPRLAIVNPDGALSVTTLPTSPPVEVDEDVTPPTAPVLSRVPRLVRTPSAQRSWPVVWTASDPGGVGDRVAYEVAQSSRPTYLPDLFTTYLDDTAMTRARLTVMPSERDQRTCLRVRTHDWAGNVSAWSQTCLTADGYRPLTSWRSSSTPWRQSPFRPVVMRYGAEDALGVASYDVSRRIALPGRPWGAYRTPAAWRRTRATSVSRRLPPGTNVCFRLRARDRAGNVSRRDRGARERCTAVPYDDRAFVRHGDARAVGGTGIGRTLTMLRGSGSMTRRITAREIGVIAAGACVSITIAGRTRLSAACERDGVPSREPVWFTVRLPRTMTATIVIRQHGVDPALVDAVVPLR